jgi:adenosylmethionine-8-amino-7-oxononanoate aminotransferase
VTPNAMSQTARDHLWLHFTAMGEYSDAAPIPVIERGEGCELVDSNGRRYLDALSGLFTVQIGYSHGEEIAAAATAQLRELPYYSNWGFSHPRAIELSAELAELAPGDLERVFFVNSGSEAVESAIKLARQFHMQRGERRWKVVGRRIAYHGTTLGALSVNGIPPMRSPFEPLVPDAIHVANTDRYRRPEGESEEDFCAYLVDDFEQAVLAAGPDTVALALFEPMQAAGGALAPPRGYFEGMRTVCDRYGILMCCDEVITGFGRLGRWFASERFGAAPDMITCAKGLSSGYASIGALIASDRVAAAFDGPAQMFTHGSTFGGHPVNAAVALANLAIMKRERLLERVTANEARFRETLAQLLELPIVGDLRGAGYFYAIELVKDKETKAQWDAAESDRLLRRLLSPRMVEKGLICRADDRGEPVVVVAPPLIAGPEEFDRIVGILGDVLGEVQEASRGAVLQSV